MATRSQVSDPIWSHMYRNRDIRGNFGDFVRLAVAMQDICVKVAA